MRSPSTTWFIAALLAGCSQSPVVHTDPGPAATGASAASSVVTGLELVRAAPNGSLMVALRQIRPWFLTARGGTVLVSVDGLLSADAAVLSGISVVDVCTVRLHRGTSAVGRSAIMPNGDVNSAGDLIDVSLRHDATSRCGS